MRIPRSNIVSENDFIHLIWKCHNDSPLLKDEFIKKRIINLYLKNQKRYQIKIYAFNILDNHCHFLVRTNNAKDLGDFTRTVHSQISKFINLRCNRNSQAIRDRYKSPPIRSMTYMKNLLGYIWLNKYKSNQSQNPFDDKFCSLYHSLRNTEIGRSLSPLSELGFDERLDSSIKLLRKLALSYITEFNKSILGCYAGKTRLLKWLLGISTVKYITYNPGNIIKSRRLRLIPR